MNVTNLLLHSSAILANPNPMFARLRKRIKAEVAHIIKVFFQLSFARALAALKNANSSVTHVVHPLTRPCKTIHSPRSL
jgi:hypothetical protein